MSGDIVLGLAEVSLELSSSRRDMASTVESACAEIERLRGELEWTRQSWVNGDDPDCERVCVLACKGPCEGVHISSEHARRALEAER